MFRKAIFREIQPGQIPVLKVKHFESQGTSAASPGRAGKTHQTAQRTRSQRSEESH